MQTSQENKSTRVRARATRWAVQTHQVITRTKQCLRVQILALNYQMRNGRCGNYESLWRLLAFQSCCRESPGTVKGACVYREGLCGLVTRHWWRRTLLLCFFYYYNMKRQMKGKTDVTKLMRNRQGKPWQVSPPTKADMKLLNIGQFTLRSALMVPAQRLWSHRKEEIQLQKGCSSNSEWMKDYGLTLASWQE